MAPTELLVRQHARTIAPLAEAAGIRFAVLTGREKGREREAILAYIDEHDTIEGAPALKDEHLPVFDCAFSQSCR